MPIVTHSNIAIAPGEYQCSFREYNVGVLFQWVSNGLQHFHLSSPQHAEVWPWDGDGRILEEGACDACRSHFDTIHLHNILIFSLWEKESWNAIGTGMTWSSSVNCVFKVAEYPEKSRYLKEAHEMCSSKDIHKIYIGTCNLKCLRMQCSIVHPDYWITYAILNARECNALLYIWIIELQQINYIIGKLYVCRFLWVALLTRMNRGIYDISRAASTKSAWFLDNQADFWTMCCPATFAANGVLIFGSCRQYRSLCHFSELVKRLH